MFRVLEGLSLHVGRMCFVFRVRFEAVGWRVFTEVCMRVGGWRCGG